VNAYPKADPSAVWEAAGATGGFVAALGSVGTRSVATSLHGHARCSGRSLRCLCSGSSLFVSIPHVNPIWSIGGPVIFRQHLPRHPERISIPAQPVRQRAQLTRSIAVERMRVSTSGRAKTRVSPKPRLGVYTLPGNCRVDAEVSAGAGRAAGFTNLRPRRPPRRLARWLPLWRAGQLKQQYRRRRWCGDRAEAGDAPRASAQSVPLAATWRSARTAAGRHARSLVVRLYARSLPVDPIGVTSARCSG
jgi:hypothetical protein